MSGIQGILSDRREFLSRLKFEDANANICNFSRPYSEQRSLIKALSNPEVKTIVVLKSRQIGMSTANCANIFFETFTARKPIRTLVVTNHNDTTKSMFGKFCGFFTHLPGPVRAANPFRINRNEKTLISERTGALIDHMTARGSAHGRGWTYQRLVAEELAFWPHPEEVWSGLKSTIHRGPEARTVIISTPNGPGNFYHERVIAALEAKRQGRKDTVFLFSRWSDHPTYRQKPPKDWQPSPEEYELSQQYQLDMDQLYWRHEMIFGVDGMGERKFRREYPLTVEDGFLVMQGSWFDVDYLNEVLSDLPQEHQGETRIFEEARMDRDYVIGCDPSWCTGGDYAVACVLDQTGEQVAVLSTNQGGEVLFAEKLSDLARYYHARVLVESNTGGAGRVVIRKLLQENISVWRDEKNKDWTTHKGNKEQAFAFARQLVNSDAIGLRDHATIQELMHIREEKNRIEGQDGYHDDHADALVLACWALRTCPGWTGKVRHFRQKSNKKHPLTRIAQM
tara:strand:- start:3340 stop:4866 length:1527 start_codon:yes stop_codon:yes gene_type:complete